MRRTEVDTAGKADPGVAREPDYSFGHVISRVDRLEILVRTSRVPYACDSWADGQPWTVAQAAVSRTPRAGSHV